MAITITFSIAGSFTIEDDGTPGNGTSIVRRDSDGAVLAIVPHPADSLTFRAIVDGVNLTFNVTDSFGTGTLTVGSLTNIAETPDNIVVKNIRSSSSVTLVADGAITEGGSDFAADIVASSIILSAGSGIGTGANALETQTAQIEAETNTGGISIANVGALQVGGFSADVDGLDVVTSGDILLTNLGSITLADETEFDSVHGGNTSGNVTLVANGFDSDISSIVDQSSIIAPRGDIVLTAGRDVSFGLAGTEFGNDVRANGSITVNAGRDFLLSGFADFFADGVVGNTGGNLIVNAGRHISLLDDTGNSASLAVLGVGGGDVILNAGPNGLVTLEPPSVNTISSGAGDVIINADRLFIGASSGITTPGVVTLRPVSDGRDISLGSLSDGANALELSDGELDRIFANTLVLGGPAAGMITVGAPIAPGSVTNFTLRSGGDIIASFSLTAPGILTLNAGDSIHQLAASVITATTFNALVDQVGDDVGAGGVTNFLGTVTVTAANVTGGDDADTLRGTANADFINGDSGNDTMIGGAGSDTYRVHNVGDVIVEASGEGTDTVQTSAVTHSLSAHVENLVMVGSGNIAATGNGLGNTMTGNGGANSLFGLGGNDRLNGAGGADHMEGGAGHDTYVVDNVADVVVEAGASGTDTVEASVTYQLPTHFERLILTGSADITGTANSGANDLIGNSGDNFLFAGSGNDDVEGGAGNDRLYGHIGNDDLIGGSGDDRFVFNTAAGAGNVDDILDFVVADDAIQIARYAFAGFGGSGVQTLSASAFVLGTAAGDANDRILYDQATGNIFHDADGTGAAAAVLFATVTAGLALTNADFIIYG